MRGQRRFFYGWLIVAVSALGLAFSGGPIVVYAFSVFAQPMIESFHVGRGAVSLAFTIHNVASACCSPLVGWLVDRHGARKVILCGLALFAAVLLSAPLVGPHVWQLYLFYFFLAVGAACGIVPYTVVIARWFDRRRGLALGFTVFGLGVGAAVMPSIAQRLIASLGWRMAFACFGAAILVVPIGILVALLEERPDQRGLQPDGDPSGLSRDIGTAVPGMDWPAIRRTPTFWVLVASFMLSGAAAHACVLHLSPLLRDRGLTPQDAALGASAVGIAVMFGRLGSGYLQDRFFAPHVAKTIFGLASIGILILWRSTGAATAISGACLVGLAMGAEADIVGFLMSRYFGLRAIGTSVAVAWGGFVLAGGIGTFLMGAGFDATGTYGLPLAGFFVAMLAAVALLTRLGPYRFGVVHEAKLAA